MRFSISKKKKNKHSLLIEVNTT